MNLSERMKSYENTTRLEKGVVIIRVDGKAFHTWTRKVGAHKPFDYDVQVAMWSATANVASEMQGFRLAYTQSDEATFMLTNLGEKEAGWFDYKLSKLTSVTASLFTHYFNKEFSEDAPFVEPGIFDARAFNVPLLDSPNVFVWRQQDWKRNSVAMLAQSLYPHKDLMHKNLYEQMHMCEKAGKNWDDLYPIDKYGTFVTSDGSNYHQYANYQEVAGLMDMEIDILDPV